MSFRSSTPPILQDPIEGGDESYDWYYDEGAGGYTFTSGKFKGKRIHETSISYLSWCDRKFYSNSPVKQALHIFYDGLRDYARTNYGDFIVPFGRKHKGSKIRKCRDKPWLLWAMNVTGLRRKYDVFFIAVEYWLANPNHQEVHRDIGELLDASKYKDDLDLEREADGSDEEPTQSDKEFIASDDDVDDVQDLSEGEGHKTVSLRSNSIGSLSGSENDDGSPASGTENLSARTSGSTSPVSERLRRQPKQTAMRTRKRKGKEGPSRRTKKPFIVVDDDENGSEEYEPSDESESDQPPDRIDHSSSRTGPIRRLRSKRNDLTHPYPTSRRKSDNKITSISSSSRSGPDARSTRRSPRKHPRKNVIQSAEASEEETEHEDQPLEPRTPSPARPSLSTVGSYEHGEQRSRGSDTRITAIQDQVREAKHKVNILETRLIAQYLENAQHPVDIPDNVQEALNVVVKYIRQHQSVFDGETALQGLTSLDISRSPNMTIISPSLGRIGNNLFNDSSLTHTPQPSPSKAKKRRPSIVSISESDEPVTQQPSKSNLTSPKRTKRTQEQSPQSRKRRRTSSSDEYVPSTDDGNVAFSATLRTPTRAKAGNHTSLGTRTASQETEPGGSRPRPYVLLTPRSRRISGVE